MTNAMRSKFEQAVKEFKNEHPKEYVHGYGFNHYGAKYRIEETKNEYNVFKYNPYGIEDTLVETITK